MKKFILLGKEYELKKCPFCSSFDLKVYENSPSSDVHAWPHVVCLNCGAGHTSVILWNTRAAD